MLEFLLGFYVGVGLCAGISFYLLDDPWDDPRWVQATQAAVVSVVWVVLVAGIILPEMGRTLLQRYRRPNTSRGGDDA